MRAFHNAGGQLPVMVQCNCAEIERALSIVCVDLWLFTWIRDCAEASQLCGRHRHVKVESLAVTLCSDSHWHVYVEI